MAYFLQQLSSKHTEMQLEIEAFVSKCSALQNDDDGENKYSDDLCQHVQFCLAKGVRVLIIYT